MSNENKNFYKHTDKVANDGLGLIDWNELSNAVAGGEGLRLARSTSDKVGIGISNDNQVLNEKLEVKGNAIINGIKIGKVRDDAAHGIAHKNCANDTDFALSQWSSGKTTLNSKAGQELYFCQGKETKMIIASNGNVGIGTATPDDNAQLEVEDDAIINNLKIGNVRNDPSRGIAHENCANETDFALSQWSSGKTTLNSKAGQELYFCQGKITKMIIASNGNVGIGTASPNKKLQVNGSVKATNFIGNGAQLTNLNPDHINGRIKSENLPEGLAISNNGKSNFTGNVGIGVSNPNEKLEVDGNVHMKGDFRIENSESNIFNYAGLSTTEKAFKIYLYRGWDGHNRKTIYFDGHGDWDIDSDRRLKTNIIAEENILHRLLQLEVKNYNWKSEPNQERKMIGFIAQEVQPLFPNLVKEYKDKNTNQSTLTLAYSNFGVLAVGAIQELKAQTDEVITSLKAEIKALKEELNGVLVR